MDELTKATAIISAALGVEAPEVAELLTSDDAVQAVTARLETKFTELRDQGDKRATKKTRTAVENAFKSAGVEDASFDKLPAAIEALQTASTAGAVKDLTDEQLLKLPLVVKALNAERLRTETAVEAARTEERTKLEKDRQAFNQQRTEAAVRAAADAEITRLNPNFTPGKEAAQRERLIRELLADGGYQLTDAGEVQLVDTDGHVLPGKLGNGVAKFADLVRERAEDVYGLPKSEPRDSTGLRQDDVQRQGGPNLQHYKGALPKTEEEFNTLVNDPSLAVPALQEVRAYWKEKQAG